MSADVRVVAFMRAKPGEEVVVRDAILACAEKSVQEDGNLFYATNVAENDPGLFVVIEQWTSAETRARHLRSAHFLTLKNIVDEQRRLSEHTFIVLSPLTNSR